MLTIAQGKLVSGGSIIVIGCFTLGTLIGSWLDIESRLEQFGGWLKIKTGSQQDGGFVGAFVDATLTVCIGAMAVVGSIEDGLNGNYSLLAAKAVLDFIIIFVMTSSMGRGCAFSAIPVGIFQGTITFPCNDRYCTELSLHDRLHDDFLLGRQFDLGQKIQRCQHAAYADLRRDCRRHLASITCE